MMGAFIACCLDLARACQRRLALAIDGSHEVNDAAWRGLVGAPRQR